MININNIAISTKYGYIATIYKQKGVQYQHKQ